MVRIGQRYRCPERKWEPFCFCGGGAVSPLSWDDGERERDEKTVGLHCGRRRADVQPHSPEANTVLIRLGSAADRLGD